MGRQKMCGASSELRHIVKKIHEVGIRELEKYYEEQYPRRNFKRSLRLVGLAAEYGYAEAAHQSGCSRQLVNRTTKEMYNIALELEEKNSKTQHMNKGGVMRCKYLEEFNEICTNPDCPLVADCCPVPNEEGVCRFENRVAMTKENKKRLIDANALTDNFSFLRKMWSGTEIMTVIDETPTIDAAEVVHGQWLPTSDDNKKRCSRCDIVHLIAQYPHGQANYCPNCGAKMYK